MNWFKWFFSKKFDLTGVSEACKKMEVDTQKKFALQKNIEFRSCIPVREDINEYFIDNHIDKFISFSLSRDMRRLKAYCDFTNNL